jgi:hypothetical protein
LAARPTVIWNGATARAPTCDVGRGWPATLTAPPGVVEQTAIEQAGDVVAMDVVELRDDHQDDAEECGDESPREDLPGGAGVSSGDPPRGGNASDPQHQQGKPGKPILGGRVQRVVEAADVGPPDPSALYSGRTDHRGHHAKVVDLLEGKQYGDPATQAIQSEPGG